LNPTNYITKEDLNNNRVEVFEILRKEDTYFGTNTICTDGKKRLKFLYK